MVRIISIGCAVPPTSYTQEESFERLGYPRQYKRIFTSNGIDKRHLWLPFGSKLSWQEMTEEYRKGVIALSKEALLRTLHNVDASDVHFMAWSSCTGFCCPSVPALLMRHFDFPSDMVLIPIVGDGGCASAGPALRQAHDFAKLTGKMALAVSAEVCSTCYYPEDPSPDPRNKYQLLRSNALFGDGASAVLLGASDKLRYPEVLDFETLNDPANIEALGLEWREGRLSCVLSPDVPEIAGRDLALCAHRLLHRWCLLPHDISYLICHPGGKRVLDSVRDAVGFTEEQMKWSREGLRLFGNCSSASVGLVGDLLAKTDRPTKGYGLMLTVGSGVSCSATLLRWGTE